MKKITQFSTIGALMAGHHSGECALSVGGAGRTFGLGCSDLVNAEVTIRQGVAYVATAGQPVQRVPPLGAEATTTAAATTTTTNGADKSPAGGGNTSGSSGGNNSNNTLITPFIQVSDFTPDATVTETDLTQDSIEGKLRQHVAGGRIDNTFYMVQVSATFDEVCVRRPQPLAPGATRTMEELARDQQVEAREGERGFLVGLWTPQVFGRLSVPGFHLHFVNEAGDYSGHVLRFRAAAGELAFEEKHTIEITTPTSEAYKGIKVDLDSLDGVIHKVEK